MEEVLKIEQIECLESVFKACSVYGSFDFSVVGTL